MRLLIFHNTVDVGILLVSEATVRERDRRPGAVSLAGTRAPGRTVPAHPGMVRFVREKRGFSHSEANQNFVLSLLIA